MWNSFELDAALALLRRRQDAVPVLQAALEIFYDSHDIFLTQGSVILGIDWPRRRAVRGFTLSYLLLDCLLNDELLHRLLW